MVRVVALVLVRGFDGNVRHSLELSRPRKAAARKHLADRWQDNYGFMSQHPGGANFAMCEGSVHFINELMCVDTTIYPTW